MKIIDFEKDQPKVEGKLLWPEFDYEGLKLDLYGTVDSDGYTVEDVAIAHTRISVLPLLSAKQLEYFDSKCFWTLPNAKEREQDARAEAYERAHG